MAGRKGRSGGRNSKSPAAHKLHGTHRKDRHAGKQPPEPTKGRPEPPAMLGAVALAEWGRMLEVLESADLVTVADGAMLFQYCEMFADVQAVRAELTRVEKLLARPGGKPAAREDLEAYRMKLWSQARQYRQAIRLFLVEFGLSPSARGRVDLGDKPPGEVEPGKRKDFGRFDTSPRLIQGGKR